MYTDPIHYILGLSDYLVLDIRRNETKSKIALSWPDIVCLSTQWGNILAAETTNRIKVRLFADCSTVMLACLSSEAGEAPQTNRIASVVKFKLIRTNYVLIQICSNITFLWPPWYTCMLKRDRTGWRNLWRNWSVVWTKNKKQNSYSNL